ncbi:MAG: hypothetical protein M3P27_10410 [Acidobacteriota bacterium]|nr:hypothetical protein [Acidobacteriota bacterium]
MTTDYGIDLLAYDRESQRAFSIQVKTRAGAPNEKRPDWKVKRDKCTDADLYAFVLRKANGSGEVWYLNQRDVDEKLADQGRDRALTFYMNPAARRRKLLPESAYRVFYGSNGLQRFLDGWKPNTARKVRVAAVGR